MIFDVLTLFCDMVRAPLNESVVGRAIAAEKITLRCHNIRDYSSDKHRRVDDTPYGGGRGMVLAPQPIFDCYAAITAGLAHKPHTVYLSPKGSVFCQKKARELRDRGHVVLLCGHYEGVDQRVIDTLCDEEISIGDYILTGGELAAAVVIDAVSRLCDGVLPDPLCHEEESFAHGLLEYPQYTRPPVFRGQAVPAVLQSGDHEKIRAWRREAAIELTIKNRPELTHAKENALDTDA